MPLTPTLFTPGNQLCKYADDTYLIVPSINSSSIPSELDHIDTWASENNLRLNPSKSCEIVFKKPRSRIQEPTLVPGLSRVTSLKVLGVTLQSNFSMTEHISNVVSKAGQSMYALRMLKGNGLANHQLHTVSNATYLFNPMTYASPAWRWFASCEDNLRLQSTFNN